MAVATETRQAKVAQREAVNQSFRLWLLQRVTAVLIVPLLGAHLWLSHFAGTGISSEEVAKRLNSPYFIAVDVLLLATVIFHGLNGVRSVAIDLGLEGKREQALSWSLVALGVAGLVLGVYFLLPFLRASALS